ncbi:cation diffusion facilitator family transporter [Butyrivibrio sp. FCS014]|uniref:cation diffusion facilitator family transporter n=1 Tax=Butyrivibrio sp. FCS014 TaxID=1408304 RepID=UPI0004662A7D|nr:cation diffusion facilitator family transporter [Butyrivibrio sp. FCS014]
MICFLAKFFIKDYDRVEDPEVRQNYGILSGVIGIALNIILVIIKMFAGYISGSIAIVSDALNNLSDVASSVVTLVGFKLSGQEADEEHPYGHGRLEYIAGLIVSLFIMIMAVELLQSSFNKILHHEEIVFTPVVGIILVISIIIKLTMFGANLQASKAIKSATLKSTAMDSISDVFSTGIVLVSVVISHFFGVNIDGIAGIIVGLFIMKTGFDAARDTISPLLGEPADKDFIDEVKEAVLSHEGVLGVHDIVVHNYGPGRIMMSLHVEVPSDKTLVEAHDLIDEIERQLNGKYRCTAVIHLDPVSDDDRAARDMKSWLKLVLEEIDPKLRYHDCRIVRNRDEEPIVSFDLEVPYKYDIKDEELKRIIEDRVKGMAGECKLDITVDKAKKED